MGEQIIEWIANSYGDIFEKLYLGNTINDAMGYGNGTVSVVAEKVRNFCVGTNNSNGLIHYFEAAGIAIALTFFLLALLELSTQERLTMEYFIKFFSKLAISLFFILNCRAITLACIDIGAGLANIINGRNSDGLMSADADMRQAIYDSMKTSLAGVKWIVMVLESGITIIVMSLVSLILYVVVYIVGFTRILELYIRATFMPVAMGLLSDDGWRGAGGRYIRKFLAISSQGAVLCCIGILSNKAMQACGTQMFVNIAGANAQGSVLGGLVVMLGLAFATVSLMFKSMSIINDVFGA